MAFTFEEFPNSDYYRSDLRKVLEYMREFEKKLNEYDVVISDLQAELARIGGLYTRVDALEQATSDLDIMRANIQLLTRNLETLSNKEQADFDNLQRQINTIWYDMSVFYDKLSELRSYVDLHDAMLENLINKRFRELDKALSDAIVRIENQLEYINWRLDQIDTSVINPWHMELGRIDQDRNAKFVYKDLADNCLTAEEYCKLGLTADSYEELGITAYEYARYGKQRTHFFWVYSPVFGWKQEISNVLTSIVNYCKDTLTATDYTDLGMTADAYSSLRLTARQYYEFNPAHIGLYEQDGTLQSRQFTLTEENGVLSIAGGVATETDGILSVEG